MVTKLGKQVQEFYNKISFPDYDLSKFDCKEHLRIAMGEFAGAIDRSIPEDASIIDVGTGTGQLSAYLSLRRKNVWGIDFSDNSLNKAKKLKNKLKLDSWTLKKVDILDEKQINEFPKFDYVLCLGVLHHTGNAYRGFQNILKLLKPNGKIAIGLYNRFGRILLKIRILLAKILFTNNRKVKDYFIRLQIWDVKDEERARGWWNDQYNHIHETTHTLGEVNKWFKKNNIKFSQTVPASGFNSDYIYEIGGIWNDCSKPFFPISFFNQLKWIFTTHREGGYWITFGEKR